VASAFRQRMRVHEPPHVGNEACAVWALCLYFFSTPPLTPIGTYVAVLAFWAALVSIWPPEDKGWSKAAWVVLFAALMAFEVHNLYGDRTQHDRDQNEARKRRRS
jgi:hypothetical protein